MKTISLVTGFVVACQFSSAQIVPVNEPDRNKPKLFAAIPVQVRVTEASLNSLFNGLAGQSVEINASDNSQFRFTGDIGEVTNKYNGHIRTVVIRSVNYAGATLTISKIIDSGGITSYQGRIVSFGHGDLFQLQQINGDYVLVKKGFYDLVNE